MKTQCLLVKLKDGRNFFTKRSHHAALIEFSTAFGAELKPVMAAKPQLLGLEELAECVCDQTRPGSSTRFTTRTDEAGQEPHWYAHYTAIGDLTPRQRSMRRLASLRKCIDSQLRGGREIRVKSLAKKLAKYNINAGAVYRQINSIKTKLENEGRTLMKVRPGVYALNTKD